MPVGRPLRATLVLVITSLTVGAGALVPPAEGTAPPPATATSTAATVIVPDLFRVNPAAAYHRLRRLGLRVTIPAGFVVGQQGLADLQVTWQSLTPLSRVAVGRTVRLRVRCAPCAQLVDVAPPGHCAALSSPT